MLEGSGIGDFAGGYSITQGKEWLDTLWSGAHPRVWRAAQSRQYRFGRDAVLVVALSESASTAVFTGCKTCSCAAPALSGL